MRSLSWPQGRAASIHNTPAAVTDSPACHSDKPSRRTTGPITATKDIIAMVPIRAATTSAGKPGTTGRACMEHQP